MGRANGLDKLPVDSHIPLVAEPGCGAPLGKETEVVVAMAVVATMVTVPCWEDMFLSSDMREKES